jgi:hypothetical protein
MQEITMRFSELGAHQPATVPAVIESHWSFLQQGWGYGADLKKTVERQKQGDEFVTTRKMEKKQTP